MKAQKHVIIEGSVVNYKPDGTGRDTYIKQINGGLISYDYLHKIKQNHQPKFKRFKFGNLYSRNNIFPKMQIQNNFNHYISDGSGRDFYITYNQGGNSNLFKNKQHMRLRKYNRIKSFLVNDFYMNNQGKKSIKSTQLQYRRSFSKYQKNQSLRLSTPKKIMNPPQIQFYYQQQNDFSYKKTLKPSCKHLIK